MTDHTTTSRDGIDGQSDQDALLTRLESVEQQLAELQEAANQFVEMRRAMRVVSSVAETALAGGAEVAR